MTGIPVSEMSDRELDVAIARAMGEVPELLPCVTHQDGGDTDPADEPSILTPDDEPEWFTNVVRDHCDPTDEGYDWLKTPVTFISGDILPPYCTSLDALSGGPEAKLVEAGLTLNVVKYARTTYCATWARAFTKAGSSWLYYAEANTEARARGEAALQALTVINAQSVTSGQSDERELDHARDGQ